ncbi:MAG: ABC transporter substrate-binding protein, partial [Betaproteobacteria bacterium]|nr:ABC transporter substrate-binding protein [Betaproteobacteria bacterium]
GRLRALAITTPKRTSVLPEVPTFTEAGYPRVDAKSINGLIAPAAVSKEYVARVQSEVAKAVKDPVVRQKLEEQGLEGVGSSPQELSKTIDEEIALNKKLTAAMGIKPQ